MTTTTRHIDITGPQPAVRKICPGCGATIRPEQEFGPQCWDLVPGGLRLRVFDARTNRDHARAAGDSAAAENWERVLRLAVVEAAEEIRRRRRPELRP